MINFRFHLVSLVAVFLALALGVIAGGALSQPTLDTLQDRIDAVEANAEQRRIENDELRVALDRQTDALNEASPFSVTDRLLNVPTVVIGVRGIDEEAVDRVVGLARRAGGEAPGVLWLESPWALENREDIEALATALGFTPTDRRAPLRNDAWDALVSRLTDGAPTSGVDPLRALVDAGFVSLDGVGTDAPAPDNVGGSGARAVLVTGVGASVPARVVVAPIARAAVEEGLDLVATEIFPDGTEDGSRGDSVGEVRGDETLAAAVSTVDDLERVEGAIASVLALSDLGRDVVGHYGVGDGIERQLPEWWQP